MRLHDIATDSFDMLKIMGYGDNTKQILHEGCLCKFVTSQAVLTLNEITLITKSSIRV